MFNTYNSYGGPSKVDVKVNEHRAPTDDSIRIYQEMRDKALESVLSSGMKDFGVDFEWTIIRNEMDQCLDFHYRLVIMGVNTGGKVSIDPMRLPSDVGEMSTEISTKLVEHVSNTVANAMTHDLFKRESAFMMNELVHPKR